MVACSDEKKFNVGVSQVHVDVWTELMNDEISNEARYCGDVDVEFRTKATNVKQQIADIDSFILEKKDVIIVSPSDEVELRPVIEKAFNNGIPVVLADRKIEGKKYTAFVGVDNFNIGSQMGDFLVEHASERKGEINVIELQGAENSSTAIERHDGFMDEIDWNNNDSLEHNQINILASVYTGWQYDVAKRSMDSLLRINPHVDYVYAHSDIVAKGAYDAIKKAGREKEIKVLGIDALPIEGGGADMVLDGTLLATHTNPICGDEALSIARKIMQGVNFERNMELATEVIDTTNASVLKLQYDKAQKQAEKYNSIEAIADEQSSTISKHKWMFAGNIVIVILLVLLFLTQYRVKKEIDTTDDIMMMQLQMQIQEMAANKTAVAATNNSANDSHVSGAQSNGSANSQDATAGDNVANVEIAPVQTDKFCEEVEQIIIKHIGDSNFSVNDIADELGISRIQLYRKIKSRSEQNVSDLIRKARLERAHELLSTTNKTISEIAYKVGFSSPSYFTKCFKDYYGYGPSEAGLDKK
ncbi:MAG: substrate-binding domain-containing protein [Bacteroidaceae bacterium]|nr:substrate-binding domain-containing protein [Bacteroidaceae bacterium]